MTHGMPPTILEFLEDRDDLSMFVELLNRSDVRDAFDRDGEFTIFAPKDSAFEQLEAPTWDQLTEPGNRDKLRRLIKRHVVTGNFGSNRFRDRDVETLGGWDAPMEVNDGVAWYVGGRVTRPDFECSDGLVHFVGAVAVTDADQWNF